MMVGAENGSKTPQQARKGLYSPSADGSYVEFLAKGSCCDELFKNAVPYLFKTSG